MRGNTIPQRDKTPLERFEEKYVSDPKTGCWEWLAFTDPRGYGRFSYLDGQLAHRFAYEHFIGDIPPGLTIDHLCRNHGCVNPAHLEAVTSGENSRRGERSTKTTCPNGHPYDIVKIHKRTGWRNRRCSICDREYFAARYQRQKAAR